MDKIKIYGEDLLYNYDDGMYVDLDGEPFTGLAHELGPDGALVAEDTLVNGLYEGVSRSWHPGGQLRREVRFLHDGLHGPYKEWHANGQLKTDGEYEHGICVRAKTWDDHGTLLEDRHLSEDDHQYKTLEASRKIHNMNKD